MHVLIAIGRQVMVMVVAVLASACGLVTAAPGASFVLANSNSLWKAWLFGCAVAALLLTIGAGLYRARMRTLLRHKNALEDQITARTLQLMKQMELVQQQKCALEESNAALALANRLQENHQSELTRFLAVASHDLRQPMHALNLYLSALSQFTLPPETHALFGNVRECAQILDGMFLALLDLSRLDAQVVQPQIVPFPVDWVLTRLKIEFAPQAAEKKIGFRIETSSHWVASDTALVEQILSNLVANALRYTLTGEVVIQCSMGAGKLRISVTDTGIGITAQQQKAVFNEFWQARRVGQERLEGLGLGLAIVQRLCKLIDAPITLVSEPGQGSTFSIDLRLAHAHTPQPPAVKEKFNRKEVLRDKLVVVVDDDPAIRDAMRVLLEQCGCNVITSSSASDAIDRLIVGERVPDLLIADYCLNSHETGLDVIAGLRAEFNQDVIALLITGDTMPDRIHAIVESGIPVLHKPVAADALLDVLAELIVARPRRQTGIHPLPTVAHRESLAQVITKNG
ncbi:MAG: hybrid sensor histidine kinase/response regulator [Herminiimonas sp.]|nr:hybrid sensor histidine kinase/response regulator [Herminiimonas sp.]